MALNFPMIKWRLRRGLSRHHVDIRTRASRSWLLCPGDVKTVPPAIYLDGALERISGFSPWRSWDVEREMIRGGKVVHGPTRAHLVESAEIVGAYAYSGRAREQAGIGPERLFTKYAPEEPLKEACLLSTNFGSHYFGTFLRYDMPLALLPDGAAPAISMVTKSFPHGADYRRLMGVSEPRLVHNVRIDRLMIYHDHAQNASKAERYRSLRSRIRGGMSHLTTGKKTGVYIRRGKSGELRVLENEQQVEDFLRGLGFAIVDPEVDSAEMIVQTMLDSKLVVSVEGSQISHAIFTIADQGAFLVIQPPDRFSLSHKEFADRMDMRFAFLVGVAAPEGFTVSVDDLNRMINLLL